MKSIKALFLCAILLATGTVYAVSSLNLHYNTQRFLDKDKHSIIHIDYQIPYNNLVFLAHKGGYFAEVDVSVEVVQNDSVLFNQAIKDNIGISIKEDASSDKTYLNRISFYLNDEPYEFRLTATDANSKKFRVQSFSAAHLEPDTIISDLELCSTVRPDSSSYLEKFHRGKVLYQTQPSLIFDKNYSDYASLYFEVYSKANQLNESGLIVLTVVQDSVIVSDDFIDFYPRDTSEGITLKIPLADLVPGKYEGSVELHLGESSVQKDFVFFVTEPRQERYFVFPNSDDDFQLLKYYLGGAITASWKSYDDLTKSRYVSQTWKSWANANNMNTQTMLDIVRERVDYTNNYFSFFDPGWTTDMGRIHIRNGKPDEIEKDTSTDETRFVRKDYQIWKYRGKTNAVYLFVDIQMNGNYKLIYVENDDRESSNPDYMKYLGDDFDASVLEN